MASIHKEIATAAAASHVWDALRDAGALHTRLAPGFVVDTQLETGARVVTFANGAVARELIVTVDDAARRVVWSSSAAASRTTTPPRRCSATATMAAASSGSPTCCRTMRLRTSP